jgi:hypothetical protein
MRSLCCTCKMRTTVYTRKVHQGVNSVFSVCLIVCLSGPINDSLMSSLVVVATG